MEGYCSTVQFCKIYLWVFKASCKITVFFNKIYRHTSFCFRRGDIASSRRNYTYTHMTICRDIAPSQSSAWCKLLRDHLHPYHMKWAESLQPEDWCPRLVIFARCYFILFMNKDISTRAGIFNQHNVHVWSHDNPRGMDTHAAEQRFLMNVRACILDDYLIGPYIFPHLSDGRISIEGVLPELFLCLFGVQWHGSCTMVLQIIFPCRATLLKQNICAPTD